MAFFDTLSVSASGLTAQKFLMDVISENIANAETTKAADGRPYKRRAVLFQERGGDKFSQMLASATKSKQAVSPGGVMVSKIVEDNTPGNRFYQPEHPDADADGYVLMPNVNVVKEMVNMITASRAYEANITAMNITKAMISKTLEISRQ